MKATTRKADSKGRVTLYADFSNHVLVMERVGEDEVRIRKAKPGGKPPSLRELLKGITEKNIHAEVDFGPPVGKELL